MYECECQSPKGRDQRRFCFAPQAAALGQRHAKRRTKMSLQHPALANLGRARRKRQFLIARVVGYARDRATQSNQFCAGADAFPMRRRQARKLSHPSQQTKEEIKENENLARGQCLQSDEQYKHRTRVPSQPQHSR